MARQERRVHVHRRERRQREQGGRQDLAVRGDDHEVRTPGGERGERLRRVRTLAGRSSGTPSSPAASDTGDASEASPRPRGRSGCETTPTSVVARASARRLGTANAGVPMNTDRNGRSAGHARTRPGGEP